MTEVSTAGGPPQQQHTTTARDTRYPNRPHRTLALRTFTRFAAALALTACASASRTTDTATSTTSSSSRLVAGAALPRTRAERTAFRETSTHADVVAFLDSLRAAGASIAIGSMGTTTEGRTIPYVIASRPLVRTPEDARRSGRPVVYVQGNIHAGEVEGKEALQALLRDLTAEPRRNVLDSLILIAVPIYNGDGNERFDHQARNRGAQNGPEMVGQRPNARGFDLNRDYMKVDAPETRASLAMFTAWAPHVFVDLHTTNGSYHGYNLTYSPSLNPAAELPGATFGGAYARDSLLPDVQRRTRERHGITTFPYGNFAGDEGPASVPKGWLTYDHRPRFGTNYYALRGGISILSEAYSHDPFDVRVKATYAFVRELLSLVAERGGVIQAQVRRTEGTLRAWDPARVADVPVRARLTTRPFDADVIVEQLEPSTDTVGREPGVRRGLRRTGRYRTERMPVFDRFEATVRRPPPFGYAVAAGDTGTLRLLRAHGIELHRLTAEWVGDAGPQWVTDSVSIAARPFQGRREARLLGHWAPGGPQRLAAGTYLVPVAQPLGAVAMYLLEPESDDGVANWDVGGRVSAPQGAPPPIVRLATAPAVARERAP
ncbi:MAG: M14 family metallopeptidase [Gemmatimonadetes bacterium]|nr:M14 family metallopeptidase [Gemmatimonadota bacterium]